MGYFVGNAQAYSCGYCNDQSCRGAIHELPLLVYWQQILK